MEGNDKWKEIYTKNCILYCLISMLFYEPININVYDLDRCIDHIKVEKRKIH